MPRYDAYYVGAQEVVKKSETPSGLDIEARARIMNILKHPEQVDLGFLANVLGASEDWVARNNAAVILGLVKKREVFELLIRALNDIDLAVQETAKSSLVVHGKDAIPYLTTAAYDEEQVSWVRSAALSAIDKVEATTPQPLGVWQKGADSQVLHWRPIVPEDIKKALDSDTLIWRDPDN